MTQQVNLEKTIVSLNLGGASSSYSLRKQFMVMYCNISTRIQFTYYVEYFDDVV